MDGRGGRKRDHPGDGSSRPGYAGDEPPSRRTRTGSAGTGAAGSGAASRGRTGPNSEVNISENLVSMPKGLFSAPLRRITQQKPQQIEGGAPYIKQHGKTRVEHPVDYSQHFVDTGRRPQNYIREADKESRWLEVRGARPEGAGPHLTARCPWRPVPEHPAPEQLEGRTCAPASCPADHTPRSCGGARGVASPALTGLAPPSQTDLRRFPLPSLGAKFDVIYMDPPWEEYTQCGAAGRRLGAATSAPA